jgi:flagellar basal body-associated protein FliL
LQGKGTLIILLLIIAVLTLIIAGMTAYIFISAGASNQTSGTASKEPAQKSQAVNKTETKVFNEGDLVEYPLYEEKQYFNLKNADSNKITVIQVQVSLEYIKKVKGIKSVEKRLLVFDNKIKESIIIYFLGLTLDDVKRPETMEKTKKDLTQKINELLTSGDSEKAAIVNDVVFTGWVFQ